MTILYANNRESTLAAAGWLNNPLVTGAAFTESAITMGGATETQAPENAYTGTTFDPWVATITATTVVWRIDFGSAVTPTFVAMAAHNLGDLGGDVGVRYSDDDVTYTQISVADHSPTNNDAIGWRFNDGAHRYWDLQFTNLTASDVLSVGLIWFGAEIIIPQRIYQGYTPPITPTQVDLNTNVSEGAQLLGSAYIERGSMFETNLTHIPPTFVRGDTWTAFQRRWNRGNGAFWAWRPRKYGDLFYAWRTGGPIVPTNSGPKDYMSIGVAGRVYHE